MRGAATCVHGRDRVVPGSRAHAFSGPVRAAWGVIQGSEQFKLIGDQDVARQHILHAVASATTHGKRGIVVVTGGPGTGKTVIACRLFADLCARDGDDPRLLSPSSTITKQLRRAVGPEAKGLFGTLRNGIPGEVKPNGVILLDEAHRTPTDPQHRSSRFPIVLGKLIRQARVTVIFLDERQVVRSTEGITASELESFARANDLEFARIDLASQFRCNGSRTYLKWVDELFNPTGRAPAWHGADYDLAVARDPDSFTGWVESLVRAGSIARIAAGYCWPWTPKQKPPLRPDVEISWQSSTGERTWERAVLPNGARWSVALALGLRQGEALGMRWGCIDLKAGTLRVFQLKRTRYRHGCDDPNECGK